MEVSLSKVQVVIVQEHATPPHKRFMLLLDQLKDKLVGPFHNMKVERQRCLHIALHFQRSQGWGRTLKHSNKLNCWKC